MSGVGSLVFDLFESLCNSALSAGEARLLKLKCGVRTGYPPMRSAELALRFKMKVEEMRRRVALTLVKLPQSDMEVLKAYLDDEEHRFHQDLTPAQRIALKRSLEIGLELQRIRKTRPANITQTAEGPQIHAADSQPETDTHSSSSALPGDRAGRLTQIHLPITSEERSDRIFELLILTREWLNEAPLTYQEVWRKLIPRMASHAQPQYVCDLWYALGIFPAIDFHRSQSQLALVTVDETLGTVEVRNHALRALVDRVTLIPETLALVAQIRRSSTPEIRRRLSSTAEITGVQMRARLRSLEALGALQNEQGWSITNLGAEVLETLSVSLNDIAIPRPRPSEPGRDASRLDGIGFLEL